MKTILITILFSVISFAQQDFERAEQLYREKKYQDSKNQLISFIAKNPNHLKGLELLGDCYAYLKDWDNCKIQYYKLKNIKPNHAEYWYKYGGAIAMKAKSISKFSALGLVDDIENAFLKAAKLDSKHIGVRWALVMFYSELPGLVGGSESKAKKYADELLNISKVDGYLAHGYIQVYHKRFQKAETFLVAAHRLGNSKTTFEKLYDLYLNKLKDKTKANKLKTEYEK